MRGNICIADLLGRGAGKGKHRRELSNVTGLDDRELRMRIQEERLKGTPILSDTVNGYYLPENKNEVAECVSILRSMSGEIARTANAIEAAAAGGAFGGE